MTRILITGATGFVGRTLCAALRQGDHLLTGTTRDAALRAGPGNIPLNVIGDIGPDTDWSRALAGAEIVIHLAARTHVMKEDARDPLAEYRRINRDGTRHLAASAAAAGVKRLIFLSSIKVNGERTDAEPFRESAPPQPEDGYGISKWEAEQALTETAASSELETVIIRPPLIYGPGVKGNLLSLLRACAAGRTLPLGAIANRRSLISVQNLCDAITRCIDHPDAVGKTFLIRDGEDLSTPALFQRTANALGTRVRLLSVSPKLLRLAGKLAGRAGAIGRLTESLTVDDSLIRETLGWAPPFTVDRGLATMAAWFLDSPANRT